MKIQQECLPFRPITIKLEKQAEAEAFYGLMQKLQNRLDDNNLTLSDDQRTLLAQIITSRSSGVTI
jgi:hypothetical protein